MDELYDLGAGLRGMRNLIDDPASQGALNAMKAELERLKLDTR